MKNYLIANTLIYLMASSSIVQAQASDGVAAEQKLELFERSHGQVSAGSPIDRSDRLPKFKFELTAGAKEKKASIAINLSDMNLSDPQKVTGTHYYSNNKNQLSVILSTPWDQKNDAVPISIDGLAADSTATLSWKRFSSTVSPNISSYHDNIQNIAQERCVKKAKVQYTEDVSIAINSSDPIKSGNEALKKLNGATAVCSNPSGGFGNLVSEHYPERSRQYTTSFFVRDSSATGLEGTIGYREFKFVDPTTLSKMKDKKVTFSVKASYTQYLRSSATAFDASFSYKRGYESQSSKLLCPVTVIPSIVECVNQPAGAPKLDEGLVSTIGFRHRLSASGGLPGPIAIAPKISYDALQDVFAASMPIYFVPGKDDTLTGGLNVGYRSDKKDVSVGLFVGLAFSNFP